MNRCKWAVFISGRGSNLTALLELRDAVTISVVVSSNPTAPGILKARRAGVPVVVLEKKIDWERLHLELKGRGVDRIFLAGFMRVVPAGFIEKWRDRILNLHPSLLPQYPGLNSIERAYNDRAELGLSVHIVTEGVDEGPVLLQRRTLTAAKLAQHPLEASEFYVHVDEQRLVKETALKWNP